MCFDYDSRPPDLPAELIGPPIAGGAAAEILEVVSADGTHFSAALAPSSGSGGSGVVILPDVRGLYPFYSDLAERFAAAGHHAIAIDYFGRTAGLGERDEDFDFWPHVMETRPPQIQADAAAAIAALRERVGDVPVVAVGFCFGGTMANTLSVLLGPDLAAAAPFYGGAPKPEDVSKIKAAILIHHGALDKNLSGAYPAQEAELKKNNIRYEGHIYPDSVHGFFNDATPERYNKVTAPQAWARTIEWFNQYARA